MRAILPATLLLLLTPAPQAQAPASATPHVYTSNLGFSYAIPGDWEAVDSQASWAQAQQQMAQNTSNEDAKKGLACLQMGLTAHHGGSAIVAMALPFDCIGQQLSESDLPAFGNKTSEGLKQGFDIGEPTFSSYALGKHNLWIERVKGTPKAQPGVDYTVEIACGVLKKAAVCWMAMAADDAALQTFEHGKVSLDGEPPVDLVPEAAFAHKPS